MPASRGERYDGANHGKCNIGVEDRELSINPKLPQLQKEENLQANADNRQGELAFIIHME
jgi:hypothetical protein